MTGTDCACDPGEQLETSLGHQLPEEELLRRNVSRLSDDPDTNARARSEPATTGGATELEKR